MSSLSATQLEQLWLDAGGAASDAATMAAIALAESGGSTTATNNTAYPNKQNYSPPRAGNLPEFSIGPWQINIYAHPQWTEAGMLDPAQNAKAALTLRDSPPYLNNWSTYTRGTYAAYMPQAQTAASFLPAVRNHPPKPIIKPWVTLPALPNAAAGIIPSQPLAVWRGFWHALGENLPYYINASRASRRALRAAGMRHG